jgi:putative DNA-invertase from lambdoid prophage Rac
MRKTKMRAAIYARVSTTDQNCEMQLRDLREYCERRGWTAEEYVDTGFSGAKVSRPALDKLMRDARRKEVDVVLVWKVDRWGRSIRNLVDSVGELDRLGIRWIATTQNIDTDEHNPTSRLILHIMAAVAEYERELIRERVRAGMSTAKVRGKRLGRPKACFDRTRAQDLKAKGFSLRSIARQLGVGKDTVAHALAAAA